MTRRELLLPALLATATLSLAACDGGAIDAGGDVHGLLPVDWRNPVILSNDSATDNWTGEYAMLLANSGGPRLAGIIVNPSSYSPELDANVDGWNQLVTAGRDSGLRDIPDVTPSAGTPLVRPADGRIESTAPNRSAGAQLIVDHSKTLSLPWRPLVVVTGSRLTDVADAYLLDPSVVDRVVVVSSLGATTSGGANMGWPNGELDPWADWIVGQRFRYVQISGYYEQLGDVPSAKPADLPNNPLGVWMAAKVPKLKEIAMSSDQIGVLALGVRNFVTTVARSAVDGSADATQPPPLLANADGPVLVASACDGPLAAAQLWKMLRDPKTFAR